MIVANLLAFSGSALRFPRGAEKTCRVRIAHNCCPVDPQCTPYGMFKMPPRFGVVFRASARRRPHRALHFVTAILLIAIFGFVGPAFAHKSAKEARLPTIGPAAEFTLTDLDGKKLSLAGLRGQVVALTFIFTSCADTCPLLTAKLVAIQRKLSAELKPKVFFAAITVDPERDTPDVLKRYAQAHSADPTRWAFLTGSRGEIDKVTRSYGIYNKKQTKGDVDHTFLTSLIDTKGTLRVQYLGWRFKPEEFSADLRSLVNEDARP